MKDEQPADAEGTSVPAPRGKRGEQQHIPDPLGTGDQEPTPGRRDAAPLSDGSALGDPHYSMGLAADAVLRLGDLLMGAGTGGYRVVRGMKRAARALGFDRLDTQVTATTIICTFHRGGNFRTVVVNRESPGVDASRIEALENLTHHLHRRVTAEWLTERLDQIERAVVGRWSMLVLMVAAGCACAAFGVLNAFPPVDVAIVAVAAAVGQGVRVFMGRKHVQQLGGVALSGIAASLTYLGIVRLLEMPGWLEANVVQSGFVASVLFLIPGFPLFSAIIDLSRFDMLAGISRLTYALSIIAVATFSVTLVSQFSGLRPLSDATYNWQPGLLPEAIATFVGIAGFAFLFNSSRRMVLAAATVGTVANVLRFVLLQEGLGSAAACFVGGLVVGLLGSAMARTTHIPRITTTVPASVIMIPGTAMFRGVYAVVAGDMDTFLTNISIAALSITAIGGGLVVARMLTDPNWTFGRRIEFGKARNWV